MKTLKFYSGLSTKEFEIIRTKEGYKITCILYGNEERENFKTLKETFDYIRGFYYG